MRVLVAGDLCQTKRIDLAVRNVNFSTPFGEVRALVRDMDYSIVNLECPIVVNSDNDDRIIKCGPNLKGSVEIVDAIKFLGFKCCTLANNHITDYGVKHCLNTKSLLEKANINAVGVGENVEGIKTLYKRIDTKVLAIINCCEHEFSFATETRAGANPLNPIKQYHAIKEARKKADYVLVIVHGGHEHYQLPSPRMQETYRFFVEAGADAVVNHHQHCFSGYEVYNGKPIFYGLGNFCFDDEHLRNDSWNEGYMIVLSFENSKIDYDFIPYEQCNETLGVHLLPLTAFDEKIKTLNTIIADERKLKSAFEKYCDETSRNYELVASNYLNRVLRSLVNRGLLKQPINKNAIVQLYNYVACESHRDRFLKAIEQIINHVRK